MAGGWAFVGTSSTSTTATPGGSDTNIQFNNNGSFSGSNLLITDGSGSLSASVNISASAFYGDGTNLTGLTASAVNVADGPEFSLQFRRDTPVTGEISGSSNLMFIADSPDYLQVTGTIKVAGNITASTSISASEYYIQGGNSFFFGDGNAHKITRQGTNLDINSGGNIVLQAATQVSASSNLSASAFYGDGSTLSNITTAAGGSDKQIQFNDGGTAFGGDAALTFHKNTDNLILSGTMNISASAADGKTILLGSGTGRQIGTAILGGDDYLKFGHETGRIAISGNAGIELIADTSDGVGSFGAPFIVYQTQEGSDVAVAVTHEGNVSASANISGSGFYLPDGKSIFFGAGDATKIGRNGTNLDINGTNIILNASTVVSASSNLSASQLYATTLNTTDTATIKGVLSVGPGTGVGYVASNGDPDTRIRFGASGLGSDSMSIEAGGKAFIVLDENGSDSVTIGKDASDIVLISGGLTSSVGLIASGNVMGSEIIVGDGANRTIGRLNLEGADYIRMANSNGRVAISGSAGIELIADTTDGVGSFGAPFIVYETQEGSDVAVLASHQGVVSASSTIQGTNFIRTQSPTLHSANFDITNKCSLYLVKVNAAAVTASLPGLTADTQVGETYTVKDYLGSGSTNNIHISPSGSQVIDTGTEARIQQDFGAITLTAVSGASQGYSWAITATN